MELSFITAVIGPGGLTMSFKSLIVAAVGLGSLVISGCVETGGGYYAGYGGGGYYGSTVYETGFYDGPRYNRARYDRGRYDRRHNDWRRNDRNDRNDRRNNGNWQGENRRAQQGDRRANVPRTSDGRRFWVKPSTRADPTGGSGRSNQ
jgi:hypothetical protein